MPSPSPAATTSASLKAAPPPLVEEDSTAAPSTPPASLPALVSFAVSYSSSTSVLQQSLSQSLLSLSKLRYATSCSTSMLPLASTLSSIDATSTLALSEEHRPLEARFSEVLLTAKRRVQVGGCGGPDPASEEEDKEGGLRQRGGTDARSSAADEDAAAAYDKTVAELLPWPPHRLKGARQHWENALDSLPGVVRCIEEGGLFAGQTDEGADDDA